jgi:hypothetical protein
VTLIDFRVPLDDGEKNRVLVAELMGDCTPGNTGTGRDPRRGGVVQTLLDDAIDGRADDFLSRRGASFFLSATPARLAFRAFRSCHFLSGVFVSAFPRQFRACYTRPTNKTSVRIVS